MSFCSQLFSASFSLKAATTVHGFSEDHQREDTPQNTHTHTQIHTSHTNMGRHTLIYSDYIMDFSIPKPHRQLSLDQQIKECNISRDEEGHFWFLDRTYILKRSTSLSQLTRIHQIFLLRRSMAALGYYEHPLLDQLCSLSSSARANPRSFQLASKCTAGPR